LREYIDAAAFKEMILCADAALAANTQLINELNVFPVPDGDTGTNMGLTMNNAATELRKKSFNGVSAVADCVAGALLRGARGNSGVILSLLFRGISKRIKGMETVAAKEFAAAMKDGVDAAYKAVMKPAEGTILTVARLSADAAVNYCKKKGEDFEEMLEKALETGAKALEDTMSINPVLKKAGVVDAGGKGYMVIFDAMLKCLKGEVTAPVNAVSADAIANESGAFDVFDTSEITYAFDTVYIVRKNDPDVDLTPLRAYLSSIGDCLVIGEDDEAFKVHVHTNIPGEALTKSQKYGTLELAKIENMRTQHEDILAGRKAQSTDDLEAVERELEGESDIAAPEKKYGVVAICAGEGMAQLFGELGADRIVTGGQTMNPSTADILKEVNKTPAETVFVLPNNKNIIMAAEQCAPLTEKKVVVVQTKTVPQGVTAMLNFDSSAETEDIYDTMSECIAAVHTAQITYAARNSDFDGYEIHEGEYLALLDGKLIGSFKDMKDALSAVGEAAKELDPEIVTVYYGEDVKQEEAEETAEMLENALPDAEVSAVNGGQPVYYYMISIE